MKELYAPLVAAVDGVLTGPGTLGTVLLCESLISSLSSLLYLNQPLNVFKAYKILPVASNSWVAQKVVKMSTVPSSYRKAASGRSIEGRNGCGLPRYGGVAWPVIGYW